MSQAAQGPGEPTDGQYSTQELGGPQGGSSPKRIKTSLDAGQYSEQAHELPGDIVVTSSDSRQSPTSPASATPATNPRVNGTTTSKAAQTPQWPLKVDSNASRRRTNSPTGDNRITKHTPPQRPPRPDHVPLLTELPNGDDHTPVISSQQAPRVKVPEPQYWENNSRRPPPRKSSPPNTSGASVGLGEFLAPPMNGFGMGSPKNTAPTATPTARRAITLGPPPSARRGAAAYYLPPTYVTPIPEESLETAHRSQGSFASSHVIPSSWGSSPPNLYVGEDFGENEEDENVSIGEDGRESNGGDHDEASGLVRQASLGKRHKPALTTIKSSEMLRKDGVTSQEPPNTVDDPPRETDNKPKRFTTRTLDGTAGPGYAQGSSRQYAEDGLSGGTGLLDPSSSSDESLVKMSNVPFTDVRSQSRSVSPLAAPIDPRIHQILGGLEKAGALEPRGAGFAIPRSTPQINGTSARLQNPPKTGLYTTGEQDSRNSLTSLPDLIRRATRLASVLDRGRTASRLGMLDSEESGDGREKISSPAGRRRSGSISDILASFPSPGLDTPTGERPSPRWPTPFMSSGLARNKMVSSLDSPSTNTHERRRRCCGLPLWGFLLLCIIILLALAAAVVIPVTLIVIPRQHDAGKSSNGQASSLGSCQQSQPCANGGTSVYKANSCQCLCADGYAGDRCTLINDSSCVTTSIKVDNGVVNATVGSSLPKLLQAAQSSFGIPLDPSTLLALFSAANLSCTSQNALVTLNGRSQRRNLPLVETQRIEDTTHHTRAGRMAARTLAPRLTSVMASASPTADALIPGPASAITSNGLVFAAPTTTIAPSATSTSSLSLGSGPYPRTGNAVDDTTLEFARICVLYIFQLTTLNTAVIAQENIQTFLSAFSKSKFNVTGPIEIDFGSFSINLGNGTVVGGRGGQ